MTMRKSELWPHGFSCRCGECQQRTFNRVALMLRERQIANEQIEPLQMPDPMDPQEVGTTEREDGQRRNEHPQGHQRGPTLLLLQLQHADRKAGRPHLDNSAVLAREEAHCCLKETMPRETLEQRIARSNRENR